MKMRLVYALTCCSLLALLVVADHKIDGLERQSQLWQDAYTSLAQYWAGQEVGWNVERSQWQDAVTSRDVIISWWENRPPDIVEEVVEVEVVKEVLVEVVREVVPRYHDFGDPDELSAFLKKDAVSEIPPYFSIAGTVVRLWCMDYAESLRDNLNDAGYFANIQCFPVGKLPMSDRVLGAAHAMVSVRVGDAVYLVEPQTDECWKAWDIRAMEVGGRQ